MNQSGRYAAVLIVACVVGFAFQGSHGLLESTEGRYAETAREMVETGNWLVPQLDYSPHWTKPPLTYWAIIGGMMLLGENEWGVRLYSAIAFVALVWAVARIGGKLWDRRTGILAALLYATAPYVAYAASSVQTDMLLSLWEACIVLAYWEARTASSEHRQAAWANAIWIFAGLAFLTKGPPGLLTFAAIAAFEGYMRWTSRSKVRLMRYAGIAAFFAIGGAWFFVVIWRTPGLLSYFVGEEVVERMFSAHFNRNPHWYAPLYVYGIPLLFGLGPVAAVWFVAAKRYGKYLRWAVMGDYLRRHEHGAFLVAWLALPLAVLSISQSRLPLYILPMFPAVALATSRLLVLLFTHENIERRVWIGSLAMAVVLVAAKGTIGHVAISADTRPLYQFARTVAGKDAAYLCYESTRLYGLQFYLHGQLARLWKAPRDKKPLSGIDDALDDIKANPKHDTYVFVATSKDDRAGLESHLNAKGIAAQEVHFRGKYNLFVVHPGPS